MVLLHIEGAGIGIYHSSLYVIVFKFKLLREYIYDPRFKFKLPFLFLSTMGERAKKKRVAESKEARLAKRTKKDASELEEGPATDPTSATTSEIPSRRSRSKVKTAAEQSRVTSRVPSSASTQVRQSTRISSKLVKGHDDDESTMATRPKRAATVAANALLQQLQISKDQELEDPDGESNDETDKSTDFEDPDGDMELDEGLDEGSVDDKGSGDDDGSDIELIDHGKIKPVASATQKGKGPAASHHVKRKPKPPSIDEDSDSGSDESGESVDNFFLQ
jgi:hypothetical protein